MRKDVFIVNPKAGKHDQSAKIMELIRRSAEAHDLNYQIYVTEYKGHAIKSWRGKRRQTRRISAGLFLRRRRNAE